MIKLGRGNGREPKGRECELALWRLCAEKCVGLRVAPPISLSVCPRSFRALFGSSPLSFPSSPLRAPLLRIGEQWHLPRVLLSVFSLSLPPFRSLPPRFAFSARPAMEFHPLAQQAQAAQQASSNADAAAAAKESSAPRSNSPAALAEAAGQASHFRHPGVPNRATLPLPSMLTPEQLASYDRDGFLLIKAKDVWSPAEMKLLLASVNLMDNWPDRAGEYMKYYEKDRRAADPAAAPKILSRIENFVQYNPGLDFLLQGDKLPAMCTDLFGEQSIMYKEKVNYKLPGSDGFAPHQDVAAGWWLYNQSIHVSCLVSIDAATEANGCLEVAAGEHKRGMMSPEWKEIPEETVKRLQWQMVPTEPGDVLFFDSYVPHRSAANATDKPRRVLYATYAKASEGDYRLRYYADKRAAFPPDCERAPGSNYEYKI